MLKEVAPCTLRKEHKLTSCGFTGVFSDGKSFKIPGLVIIYCPNTCGYARVGVVVSKKNVRKSVTRNKYKRLIRESFRLHRKNIGNWDIVVLVRAEIAKYPLQEIRERLGKKWERFIIG